MHDLAVQITQFDGVAVDEAERVHTQCGEVEGGGGAKAAEADDEDLGLRDEGLAGDRDAGKEGLAVVAG
jgi:hypothetical protein